MKKVFLILFVLHFTLFTPQHCGAQYTNLINFTGDTGSYNGWSPIGNLTVSGDTLYGMTSEGGVSENGNIFSVQTNGTNFKNLINFTGDTGAYIGKFPEGSLTLSGNTLYGMTNEGGKYGYGNIFSVQTNGTHFKDLVDFTGDTGSYIGVYPEGSLTISGDTLYGMTTEGGASVDGNIFSVQTNGTNFKDLIEFTVTFPYVGSRPHGSLTLSGNTLYGMTGEYGSYYGNIFSVQTNGTNFNDLVDFSGSSGSYIGKYPYGSLTLSGDTLYGMTFEGGFHGIGNIFSVQTNGTNFNDLIEFSGTSGYFLGEFPQGDLTLSGDTLFGMTSGGALHSFGDIFSVHTNKTYYKDLVNFTGTSGSYIGAEPQGSLALSGGILYGMTIGGMYGFGNIFSINYTTTSIKPLSAGSVQFKIYPNPSNGIFTFSLNNSTLPPQSQNVEIYNVFGEQVYSQFTIRNSTFTIDLSGQPNGVYLYRISEDGALLGEGKLVVEH